MRVCYECGHKDHPAWKHCKYSYYIDSCSLENFTILHPELASKLDRAGASTEDEHYIYRLTNNCRWVERKAKIDFTGKGWTDGTEAYPHLNGLHDNHKRWLSPAQQKLLP